MANLHTDADTTLTAPTAPTAGAATRPDRASQAGASEGRRAQAALVARARNGDNAALTQILTEHRGRIERLAHSIVRDPMDAEEVVQDVLLTIAAKLDRFRGDANLSTWIHRIAVNTALMHRRRKRAVTVPLDEARPAVELAEANAAQAGFSQAMDPTLRTELWEKVWEAVDGLGEKYRGVFILRDVEGLSTEEAARALGLKVPAVKSRLHRARHALRVALRPYVEEPAARCAA